MSLRLFLPAAVVAIVAAAVPAVRADQMSERIDALIEEGYKAHKITPNAPTTDETFVRRIYLDVIGRIPSMEEARTFLDSTEAGKRSKLIDQLIDSEGYVSNWYNWWADILRMETGLRGEAGQAYAAWVKDSLRNNKPYDQFVKELITAEGYVWDNGAVGYYLRDAGMPLDNMSNTTQIFLGTRLACAQCHNHPFDKWTQKDYYEMAAFTFGTDTQAIANKELAKDMTAALEEINGKPSRSGRPRKEGEGERMKQSMRRIVDAILDPLKNGVKDDNADHDEKNDKMLKLPADYKYANGAPNETVTPHVIFGKQVTNKRQARKEYANWMASPENPRFTTVMANRLWKKVMGMGLVEPVDDFKEETAATNPALMKYLTQQFVYSKFDVKKMLRAFYNTKTYQRQTTVGDVPEDKPYYYPGPVMRRMSAEQIWDSVCTLVIPDPDMRRKTSAYKATMEVMKKEVAALEKVQKSDIINVAKKYAEQDFDLEIKGTVEREKLNKAREAGDAKAVSASQKELASIKTSRDALATMARNELLKSGDKSKSQFVTNITPPGMAKKEGKMEPAMDPQTYRQWDGYGDEFYRASELPSPAPNGHFLREFGQSNRQIIENSTREATVSQALNLMNGPLFEKITMEKTQFMQRFTGATTDEGRTNALFYSLFARKPTDQEKSLIAETIAEKGKNGWKHIMWALLNTREFVFIQ